MWLKNRTNLTARVEIKFVPPYEKHTKTQDPSFAPFFVLTFTGERVVQTYFEKRNLVCRGSLQLLARYRNNYHTTFFCVSRQEEEKEVGRKKESLVCCILSK